MRSKSTDLNKMHVSHVDNLQGGAGREVLDSGNIKCKVPETGTCFACSRNNEEAGLLQQSEVDEVYR